jgi:hypothetical protein
VSLNESTLGGGGGALLSASKLNSVPLRGRGGAGIIGGGKSKLESCSDASADSRA